jgi:hypothetical protein
METETVTVNIPVQVDLEPVVWESEELAAVFEDYHVNLENEYVGMVSKGIDDGKWYVVSGFLELRPEYGYATRKAAVQALVRKAKS